MNPIWAFIKTTRPVNLLIIIFTMVFMRLFVENGLINHYSEGNPNDEGIYSFYQTSLVNFSILVVIMVLLAASGNLINDYFDVKVDRINKPERITIGKTLKRRVAMISNHVMNGLAVSLGLYIGWKEGSMFYALVPPAIASALWFYSFYLKKTFILGNVLVALVISIVPVWAVYPTFLTCINPPTNLSQNLASLPKVMIFTLLVLIIYSVQAYAVSLIREVVKDAEDVEGDSAFGYRTLPIVYGYKSTQKILVIFMGAWAAVLLYLSYLIMVENITNRGLVFIGLVVVPFVLALQCLIRKNIKKIHFKRASFWLKVTLAGGLLFSITIHHLMGYIIYYF